ncbi:MBL fold metallo-hydrolase [Sphaerotilus sp.]|uniref:MBL fold metallo-hydrolase n=1 Tax=Sphaerotilus sp. TaxID=2093942 RepID=UPI002ACD9F83|nr:MBL fold metallo-hydrolase [Sphaerotilus sp.]MDZ7856274.1 MBL fold metallo-hydrolase [Sphaerotilus sp.]
MTSLTLSQRTRQVPRQYPRAFCSTRYLERLNLKTMNRKFTRWLAATLLAAVPLAVQAVEVRFQRVADGVYAHVGDKGARSVENEGLNANIGLVVTNSGAALIDSGATFQSARQIHDAVKAVTQQPLKWVFNTGGQDHRWLGNGYFAAQGIEIIAHAHAKADMNNRGNDHLQSLKATLGAKADGTVPTLPTRWLSGSDERLELGGVVFDFKHRGGAHTPGDTMVWLPGKNVLFTGDVVYVDRMLGVLPVSHTQRWLATFAVVEQLNPAVLVPGHGSVTNVATAKADTQAYLMALRAHMKKAVDDGTDASAAVKSFNAAPFTRLLNAAELMPGNASRTYLELERE